MLVFVVLNLEKLSWRVRLLWGLVSDFIWSGQDDYIIVNDFEDVALCIEVVWLLWKISRVLASGLDTHITKSVLESLQKISLSNYPKFQTYGYTDLGGCRSLLIGITIIGINEQLATISSASYQNIRAMCPAPQGCAATDSQHILEKIYDYIYSVLCVPSFHNQLSSTFYNLCRWSGRYKLNSAEKLEIKVKEQRKDYKRWDY